MVAKTPNTEVKTQAVVAKKQNMEVNIQAMVEKTLSSELVTQSMVAKRQNMKVTRKPMEENIIKFFDAQICLTSAFPASSEVIVNLLTIKCSKVINKT